MTTKVSVVEEDNETDDIIPSQRVRRRQTIVLDDSDSDAEISNSIQKTLKPHNPTQLDDDSTGSTSLSPSKRLTRVSVSESDDDNEPITSPLKRQRNIAHYALETSPAKRSRTISTGMEDEDDSDFPSILNATRARTKASQQSRKKSKGLAGKDTPTRLTRQQVTTRRHRTEKEKKLELLRRRRAGEKIDQLTDSESSEEERAALYDSQDDHEYLTDFPDEPEDERIKKTEEPRPKMAHRPADDESADEDDEKFIVEDDDELLGVPTTGLHDIPLEFTHAAHKPLKEHFRDAVEWMVHLKMNPGFNREDPIYTNAFKKLDDEVAGYARSKFVSSAWGEDFSRAIKARPTIQVAELPSADHLHKCSACNRSGHPSSFIITLSGAPYHMETLEEVEQDEDESDGGVTVNSQDQELVSEDREWYVGRYVVSSF